MGGGKKRNGTTPGPGRRVFKLKTSKSIKGKLKEFYNVLTSFIRLVEIPKSALRYREEWEDSFIEVIHNRLATGKWLRPAKKRKRGRKKGKRKSGKRVPKRPPFLLTVRFILQSGEQRGRTDAPVVVDLCKKEVRIPCVGVSVPLPERLVKALEEENRLEPRPDFVVQLCSEGRLRIIAKRAPAPRPPEEVPLRVIAVDENSRYGFVVAVFDFDSNGYCRLTRFEVFKPPNHGYREKVVSALKSYADKPAEALESVRELLPFTPTPSAAERLAERTLARKRKLNDAFVESFVARVRELVRGARGAAVAIVVDPIDAQSLQGTPLQGTLLRVRRRLKNLSAYEGIHFAELRASGRYCPFCGAEGAENGHRLFKCPRCGTVWDRDRAAIANLVLRYLRGLYKEECQDADTIRLADALLAWLKRHPGFLLR